jgi:hypothetical protein
MTINMSLKLGAHPLLKVIENLVSPNDLLAGLHNGPGEMVHP